MTLCYLHTLKNIERKISKRKSKRKSYKGKINTNFYNNDIPKEESQCIYLSVTLIDSVYRKDNNYYPQVFLERKYFVKEKQMPQYITDEIEIPHGDSGK